MTLAIEAHVGRNCPPSFAPLFTEERGKAVVEYLSEQGVSIDRLSSRGWGKAIAVAASWQPGIESARAELYFTLDGLTMPPRPPVYDAVPSGSISTVSWPHMAFGA